MKLRVITIDLAKNVFQACGVNEHIKPQFNKKLKHNIVRPPIIKSNKKNKTIT